MAAAIEGHLQAAGFKLAIVASRFNEAVCDRLVDGALDCLVRHGVAEDDVRLYRVPGSFEIPLVAKRLAASGGFDAIVVAGAIIRGETPHFDYLAAEVVKGVAQVSLDTGVPVTFGVILADTPEQALDRSGGKAGNKGWSAALAAIEMVSLLRNT